MTLNGIVYFSSNSDDNIHDSCTGCAFEEEFGCPNTDQIDSRCSKGFVWKEIKMTKSQDIILALKYTVEEVLSARCDILKIVYPLTTSEINKVSEYLKL